MPGLFPPDYWTVDEVKDLQRFLIVFEIADNFPEERLTWLRERADKLAGQGVTAFGDGGEDDVTMEHLQGMIAAFTALKKATSEHFV